MKKLVLLLSLLLLPGTAFSLTVDAYFEGSSTKFEGAFEKNISMDYNKLFIKKGNIEIQNLWGFDGLANYASNKILQGLGFETENENEGNSFDDVLLRILGVKAGYNLNRLFSDNYSESGYLYFGFNMTNKEFSGSATSHDSITYVTMNGRSTLLSKNDIIKTESTYNRYDLEFGLKNHTEKGDAAIGFFISRVDYCYPKEILLYKKGDSFNPNPIEQKQMGSNLLLETENSGYTWGYYGDFRLFPEDSGWGWSISNRMSIPYSWAGSVVYVKTPYYHYKSSNFWLCNIGGSLIYKIGFVLFEVGGDGEISFTTNEALWGTEERDVSLDKKTIIVNSKSNTGFLYPEGTSLVAVADTPGYMMYKIFIKATIHY